MICFTKRFTSGLLKYLDPSEQLFVCLQVINYLAERWDEARVSQRAVPPWTRDQLNLETELSGGESDPLFSLPWVWEGTVREPRKARHTSKKVHSFPAFLRKLLGIHPSQRGWVRVSHRPQWEGWPLDYLVARTLLTVTGLWQGGPVKVLLCRRSFGTRAIAVAPEHSLTQVLSQRSVPRESCPGVL